MNNQAPEPCHCRFTTRNGRSQPDCEDCNGTGETPIPHCGKIEKIAVAQKVNDILLPMGRPV